jgi:hypothetical protein
MTDVLTQLCSELAAETERNTHLDTTIRDICEALRVRNVGDALEVIQEVNERLESFENAVDGAYEKISAGAEKSGDPEKLGDRIDKALDEAYDRDGVYQRASDALRRYLIRQGLPADPVRLDDPDLWALYEALSDS